MPWVNVVLLVYAFLLVGLGAYGFMQTQSSVSLIAGAVAGLFVLGSVALAKTHPRWGRIAAAVIALLMIGQMGPKALQEPKWHTVTLAIVSIIVLLLLVGAHFAAMSAKKKREA